MTAKEYLTQPEELRSTIKIKEADRKRHESSKLYYKELSREISLLYQDLSKTEADISESILKVKDIRYRDILYGIYIDGKKIKKLAYEMHYDYNYMCQLHSRALKEFARVNKDKLEE